MNTVSAREHTPDTAAPGSTAHQHAMHNQVETEAEYQKTSACEYFRIPYNTWKVKIMQIWIIRHVTDAKRSNANCINIYNKKQLYKISI